MRRFSLDSPSAILFQSFLVIYSFIFEFSSAIRSASTMRDQLMKHGIIPDVITFPPLKDVLVEYSKGVMANFGNKLPTTQTKNKPWLQWSADPDHFYCLIFVDPDYPSREDPTDREYKLWLVVNIPGFDVSSGHTFVEYAPPDPPKDSGVHRFIFMVYKQQGQMKFDETYIDANTTEGRKKFSTRLFNDKYKLGNPWAMNFFHAEWFDAEKDAIINHPLLLMRKQAELRTKGIIGKTNKRKMKEAMLTHHILQDFLPAIPQKSLDIEYDGEKMANFGNTLSPYQTRIRPYCQWSADPDYYYTLVMTDLDAPNRKTHVQREWLHWMVVNIPSFVVDDGDTLTQYVGPHPKAGTGFHRYVFTVFSQGNKTIKFHEPLRLKSEIENRPNFSTFDFADKYDLGPEPWAFNFIRAQYHGNHVDPYNDKVDIITEDIDPFEPDDPDIINKGELTSEQRLNLTRHSHNVSKSEL